MFEQILLGTIQGIAEWLPISSEGVIVLVKTHIFPTGGDIEAVIHQALQLHFGTLLAALVYFRRDVFVLVQTIFNFKGQTQETQKLFSFLFISTIISGIIGITLLKLLSRLADQFTAQAHTITLVIGLLLLGTAFLELRAKKGGYRTYADIKFSDCILLGIVQGCAALPGLSRSGLTVSALLLRKFDKAYALKISFLMSMPIVLAGNILLNFSPLAWSWEICAGIFAAFAFGLATIHLFLKIAEKINFGYFVLLIGVLTIISAVV